MIKVIENLESNKKKQKIIECVNDMESVCQLIKNSIPLIFDEEEIDDIETIVVDVTDSLNDIIIDDETLYNIVIDLSLIHISEPTRLLSISYAVFCLKKKTDMPAWL